jgi:hypothetical protein
MSAFVNFKKYCDSKVTIYSIENLIIKNTCVSIGPMAQEISVILQVDTHRKGNPNTSTKKMR